MSTASSHHTGEFNLKAEITLAGTLFFLLMWGLHTLGCTDAGTEFNHFLLRQLQWSLVGIAVMLAAAMIPFSWWRRSSGLLCLASLVTLAAVTFFGRTINGMQGWFQIGSVQLQPSEIAKPLFLLYLICSGNHKDQDQPSWFSQVPRLTAFAAFAVLLALQPDFGTMLIYLAMLLIVYLLSGGSWLWLSLPLGSGLAAAIYALLKMPYVYRRLQGFLDPESDLFGRGWHIIQLRIALAHGGVSGAADGQALWSSAQLPLSHSDSAFAALCEATGLAGGLMVLAAIALVLITCYCRYRCSPDSLAGRYVMAGAGVFAFQSLLHISVNLTVFPVTGLTLPFISYGGSSMTAYMLLFGIIFSAMRKLKKIGPETSSASGPINKRGTVNEPEPPPDGTSPA